MDELKRNIKDKYAGWLNELIAEDVARNTYPFACAMINWTHDFNIGTLVRNANVFGAKAVYYVSDRRHYDRRGCVGTYKYTKVVHYRTYDELKQLKKDYMFVAVENNIARPTTDYTKFKWPSKPVLILFGAEGQALDDDVLDLCDAIVEIPIEGSVRSLNVASCSAVIFADYVRKYNASWSNKVRKWFK